MSRGETTREELLRELEATDALLERRERLLRSMPECPVHGSGCVPHAEKWVEKAKGFESRIAELETAIKKGAIEMHNEFIKDFVRRLQHKEFYLADFLPDLIQRLRAHLTAGCGTHD